MLNGPDPDGAVAYFEAAVARSPENDALRRRLAESYLRAGDPAAARDAYAGLIADGAATEDDRVAHGFAAIQIGDWEAAAARRPEAASSARAALLEAALADRAQRWEAADVAYARAASMADRPARALNNWGVSLMARGDLAEAERRFAEAAASDPTLFRAKNNLAIARARGGVYAAPALPMTDEERAVVAYNIAVVADRQGDRAEAKRLYAEALDLHPRHYPAAAERLTALASQGWVRAR
jgi:Flp pilus assembly protein TadD